MSPFESALHRLGQLTQELEATEATLRTQEWAVDTGFDVASRLLGVAARVYTAAAEAQGYAVELHPLNINATDAVITAASLMRDQNITPFELSIWHSRAISIANRSNALRGLASEGADDGPEYTRALNDRQPARVT